MVGQKLAGGLGGLDRRSPGHTKVLLRKDDGHNTDGISHSRGQRLDPVGGHHLGGGANTSTAVLPTSVGGGGGHSSCCIVTDI